MSQFFGANYLKPQYFNANYLHGAQSEESPGRSGYWRLFYTQLQEQSLKEDEERREQKQRQEAPPREIEAAEIEPATKPIAKPAPKRRTVTRIIEREPVIVVERPIYRELSRVDRIDEITPLLNIVSNDFRKWMFSVESLRIILLQRQAANDDNAEEEENINLLLLAA